MNDSFRQGDSLREEMVRNCEADSIQDFVSQQRRLRNDVAEIDEQLKATKSLANFDWDKAFEGTHADVEQEATRFAKEVKEDLSKSLRAGIDNWFETSDCLGDLVGKTWQGRIEELQKQIVEKVAGSVKNVVDSSSGGARPTPEMVIALDRVRLSLRDVYNESIAALNDLPKVSECLIDIDVDDIPVSRTFWDRIFFQSQAKVRRRLFGANSELKNEVPPGKKRKRLIPDGKKALEDMVDEQLKGILPGIPNRCSRDFLKVYVEKFKTSFTSLLKKRESELNTNKQQLEGRIEANDRISGAFETLDTAINGLEGEMDVLKNKFLRSARLARGFQIIDTPASAFSLWTAPYTGGLAFVPSGDLLKADEPEPVEVVSEGDDENGSIGAFTVWTAEFLGISLESAPESVDDESPEAVSEDGEGQSSDSAQDDSPIVVALPTVASDESPESPSDEASSGSPEPEAADAPSAGKVSSEESGDSPSEPGDEDPTPLRVVPKGSEQ